MAQERSCRLRVYLEDTGETFNLKKCHSNMTIGELKTNLELVTGIPTNLQRLYYIDEGEMPDNVTLKYNGVIKNSTIKMKTWLQDGWRELLYAAAHGDINKLISLGVTTDTKYSTPYLRQLNARQKEAWIAERAFVALFIAAHRGHVNTVNFLLINGANPNAKTASGRTALHMAVVMARSECLDQLLLHGAEAEDPDGNAETLMSLAHMTGHQGNISKLFQVQWMKRKTGIKTNSLMDKSALFAHQKFDSTLKTWHKGTYGTVYMANLLKPGEPRAATIRVQKSLVQKNRPTSTARLSGRRKSSKQTQKPNPIKGISEAQDGILTTQPSDSWQKEATGTNSQVNNKDSLRQDASLLANVKSKPSKTKPQEGGQANPS
ncbi:ankyrin repeat domain-containing protein 60 [Rhincodon typus]|uniref:ankyrin repeat domain-containing protein 60 n=1 Tax=Rhincodon typus TaxID=259920 RepID=UPI0009A25E0F|nr:ankyrin repeat domain-containing protein 60 [Rhincodon typus]